MKNWKENHPNNIKKVLLVSPITLKYCDLIGFPTQGIESSEVQSIKRHVFIWIVIKGVESADTGCCCS